MLNIYNTITNFSDSSSMSIHNIFEYDDPKAKKVTELSTHFLQQTNCPYTKAIQYLNMVSNAMSGEKTNVVKTIISYFLSNNFSRKSAPLYLNTLLHEEGLNPKSTIKVQKHILDILYLQEGLYDIIQKQVLDPSLSMWSATKHVGKALDLKDLSNRQRMGKNITLSIQTLSFNAIEARQEEKLLNEWKKFSQELEYALHHAIINAKGANIRGQTPDFADMFIEWLNDGFSNYWSLVHNIPEIFEATHGRMPNKDEYKEIIEKNMHSMIIPLTSLNLNLLVFSTRTQSEQQIDHINNNLDITTANFTLNENWVLIPTDGYNWEIVRKASHHTNEYLFVQNFYPDNISGVWPIRTGCPVMRAKTKDGRRLIEQVVKDFTTLLDTVYFPYWEKNI